MCALIALLLCGSGCASAHYYTTYLSIDSGHHRHSHVAYLTTPPTRTFHELGVFDAYSRHSLLGDMREAMRRSIVEQAADAGCDALVELPTPSVGSSARAACTDPPPRIRALCIEWEP